MPDTHKNIAILPARDESIAIYDVVTSLCRLRDKSGRPLFEEIIVCDNGSRDGTSALARQAGATVVQEPARGYGAACLRAIAAIGDAHSVTFVDADGSVDVTDIPVLLNRLNAGADLVIGARVNTLREKSAMNLPQRIGTSLACGLINAIWRKTMTDIGPLRAIRFSALKQLQMQDRACGWTAEMQIKALQHNLRVAEVDVHCLRRRGRSKISGAPLGVMRAAYGIFSTIFRLALTRTPASSHMRRKETG